MKILKNLGLLALSAIIAFGLSACGEEKEKAQTESKSGKKNEVIVGATPIPHGQILEFIKEDLQKEGVNLKIIEFTDYVTPNISLHDKSLDANFMQHKPYLDSINKDRGYGLVSIAEIHLEPIGLYSTKYKSIDSLPDGARIAIPNDVTNGGRALILLHNQGLITLKDVTNLGSTESDIVQNPKGLKIIPIDGALLPRVVDEYDGAVINGNYALQAGFKSKDAILLEDKKSPYANILVVREESVNDENIAKLKKALQSEKVKEFIINTYDGEVIPAF
ncbi:methionine ABC transporter substrate-binding protein [Helicobacter sp. MIT 00-7814]|uniref:MetQ/NlpA family ABC transporter substrate-binding protein n=1 Tax=unclassified Helicobacter TaxID=2593540 RepID=UPI000E1F0639|nr:MULTISPECIES: MetQ/NlpA family ABC transporter substrate-binding protein [unclassified Helicobacter]RDU53002.1 methionine ABC transporter substrate-binding protein [Helicobacter sp. MIT 99-10781]RDU55348.1 methionine ABC transporter substrate-binding protein [Helicobacter sp. MIT 00-7814]